jgi:hypothetical protein
VSEPAVSYKPRSDTTPESELATLAAVYRFIIDCHAKREAAASPVSRPDDPERRSDEIRAKTRIP